MNIKHLLITLICSYTFWVQISFAEEQWSLAKNEDDITVYTRHIAGSSLREFKGQVYIEVSPQEIVKVLRDADSFHMWMPDVSKSNLLAQDEQEQYHYLVNKTPWPISDRDGIYQFTYSNLEDGKIDIKVQAKPDFLPESKGKVRIPLANGKWSLAPKLGGTWVYYQMHASPGGNIPSWLANQAVVDTPFETLKSLRNRLIEKK